MDETLQLSDLVSSYRALQGIGVTWINRWKMVSFDKDTGHLCIKFDDDETWYLNIHGYHRTDGPARCCVGGYEEHNEWYVDNEQIYSFKVLQEAAQLTDDQMAILRLKYESPN